MAMMILLGNLMQVYQDFKMNENTIEYWKQQCDDYKWLFDEQKTITQGYREICDGYWATLKKKI